MTAPKSPWHKKNHGTRTTPPRVHRDKNDLTKEQRQRIEDLKFAKTHKLVDL